ncbi:Gfo/Idh/MocA family oxidoreductase [Sphingobacterium paramultivorum]|uniref:Gfo/Idh/MocA family oxidoreductase n=1 Tax=Sphingobacterium paramultivorum TaxID=2886510 RepID=A0A7G5E1Z0_9SPHI|nr:Gfo/Idh/MocA family oxidoreductase [Sphingobacterium paramultivorum]QMV68015.1 Gfo/Idh/MocA family oxidoreductase [Sphingobacterium paramultivorum]WSO16917.1 Gfo/Idh/MocA family oxidoreductase [Sphingobacterium paramultivorum]
MGTNRRSFLKLSGLAGIGLMAGCGQENKASAKTNLDHIRLEASKKYTATFNMSGYAAPKIPTVRVGFIGVGNRGSAAVERMSQIEGVAINGICDVRAEKAIEAKARMKSAGHRAELFTENAEHWKKMCEQEDYDLIYIATHWKLHAEMAIYAMEHGKHVALEIPAAITVEDCWRLVQTSEKTKKHCVMLENCCYDYFELLTLNLARQGFFGDIVHCEGAYIHDILESFFDAEKRFDFWRLKENATRNGNLYPTHGLGPICQILKVNRGNKMEYMSSMSSKDFMLGQKAKEMAATDKQFESYIDKPFRGNMNISNILTNNGSTIMLQHDVSSPRPYSRLHLISGTKAFAQKYPLPGKIAIGHVDFLSAEEMTKLEQQYTPGIVKKIGELAKQIGGHGGMDFMMDWRLIDCLRNGLPMDMDVYDAASWSVIGPLSEWSVANGSQPIEVPDFTAGHWKNNQVHDIELTGETSTVLS